MGMGHWWNVRRNPAAAVFTNKLINTWCLVVLNISCFIYIGYDGTVNNRLFWNRPLIIWY